jgi:hypothetical protein
VAKEVGIILEPNLHGTVAEARSPAGGSPMHAATPDRNGAQAKPWSMIKDIKVAMMTTWDGSAMHARPKHGYLEEFDGRLYFFTRRDSGKTDEIAHYDKLNREFAAKRTL